MPETQSTTDQAGGGGTPRFAVALAAPDLRPWLGGNTGIPGIWSFAAATPGPHLAFVALTHGNEFASAIVLERYLQAGLRPLRGRLSLVFANLEAFAAFNPQNPTATRFLDEDLNRVWGEDMKRGPARSREMRRARELLPFVETIDVLVDLHSMLWPSDPLILAADNARAIGLGLALAAPRLTVADPGHVAGRRLIDHRRFTAPDTKAAAVLVEAGQHWQAETLVTIETTIQRALALHGMVNAPLAAPSVPPQLARVTQTVTATSHDFTFIRDFRGGEIIAEAGSLIAHDGAREIRTPHDDCLMIMPTPLVPRGHTAVRLAQFEQI